ncbi:hypothetical protein Pmani_039797, partial [Petrolisthes manimaculis]
WSSEPGTGDFCIQRSTRSSSRPEDQAID